MNKRSNQRSKSLKSHLIMEKLLINIRKAGQYEVMGRLVTVDFKRLLSL
jgi:hypothetical protein